jgi:molybdopterin-guanine dinucleotide biosynthesis protein A/molybdopterin converting factor small subunit
MTLRKIKGLILTGGKSSRMGEPKALIHYHGKPHARYLYDLLSEYCDEVFLSVQNKDQWLKTEIADLPVLSDIAISEGPVRGIVSALKNDPACFWIVVACDLVNLNHTAIKTLTHKLDTLNADTVAVCFANHEKDFPEALCAIYTPQALTVFLHSIDQGLKCPVKILAQSSILKLVMPNEVDLANINTPDEKMMLNFDKKLKVQIRYFALLRDEAGLAEESRFTHAKTYRQLFHELKREHKFSLSECMVQVAVNDSYTSLDTQLTDNAKVVFIPPVAGG